MRAPTSRERGLIGVAAAAIALAAGLGIGNERTLQTVQPSSADAARTAGEGAVRAPASPQQSSTAPEPARRASNSAGSSADRELRPGELSETLARLDPALLARAREPRKVRDIFVLEEERPVEPVAAATPRVPKAAAPPALAPAPAPVVLAPAPAPAPQAPPLPYRYVGRLEEPGAPIKVFLANNDRAMTVAVGDTIEGQYRVLEIAEQSVTLLYLPLDARQTLSRTAP